MVTLSVNINKIATLRNSRGGNIPDVVKTAIDCERFGAQGITVHPRPDERHIRNSDVYALKQVLETEFNIEGYPSASFVKMVKDVKPEQVTLVPDPPTAITSNAGWDVSKNKTFLLDIISELKKNNIRTSIFIEPAEHEAENAAAIGADRVELYTEAYARQFNYDREKAIKPYINVAKVAQNCGLGLNAGHDLNLYNLEWFSSNIPWLLEVSIGHALICDALYYGLENTIQMYLGCLKAFK